MRSHTLVAIVLAGLVAFAGAAGATHVQRYEFAWRASPGTNFAQGYAQEGAASQVPITLPANATVVSFRLLWSDDIGAPDDFQLAIDGPAGHGENAGASGEVEVRYQLGLAPVGNWSVDAENEAAARAQSAATHPGDPTSAGNWTVTVLLRDAGDGGTFFGNQADTGNEWRLEVAFESYEAVLVSVTPLPDSQPPAGEPPVTGGDSAPEQFAQPPAGEATPLPRGPAVAGKSFGLIAFAAIGVGMWALVAKWRRQGRLE